MTWFDSTTSLEHVLSHVNPEQRAGRTMCGRYIEFWPADVTDDAPTCLQCLGAALVTAPDDAVHERWEDVVRHCALSGKHLVQADNDGYCCACGYQDDPS
jgi:hypothetical protein